MGKKVLKYSETEFINLLESIVKKVKKEEVLKESKKEKLSEAKKIFRKNRS